MRGMIFPPSYYREQDEVPECPECGGKPDHNPRSCTIEPPRVVPPVERARTALRRR